MSILELIMLMLGSSSFYLSFFFPFLIRSLLALALFFIYCFCSYCFILYSFILRALSLFLSFIPICVLLVVRYFRALCALCAPHGLLQVQLAVLAQGHATREHLRNLFSRHRSWMTHLQRRSVLYHIFSRHSRWLCRSQTELSLEKPVDVQTD
jgi:hypothetical protein